MYSSDYHHAFMSFLSDVATQVDELILDKSAKSLFETHVDNVFREAGNYRKYLHAEYNKAKKRSYTL